MLKNFRLAHCLLAIGLTQACTTPRVTAEATLGDLELIEASGLASSTLNFNRLWLLNDGGHSATIYALDTLGRSQARLNVPGQHNRDWEDLSSFSWSGRHWLLIADIGDNKAKNKFSTLHFIEEPELPNSIKKLKRKPALSIQFSYPDGPRDAESIAFDPISEQILILSKRDRPVRLYGLPISTLFDSPNEKHIAQLIGTLNWDINTPGITTLLLNPKRAVSHGMATALDISTDGLQAVVLGYQQAVLLRRRADQSWLLADLIALPPHGLEQAEAISFSQDGQSVYLSSEGRGAPLIRQALPQPQ